MMCAGVAKVPWEREGRGRREHLWVQAFPSPGCTDVTNEMHMVWRRGKGARGEECENEGVEMTYIDFLG